MPFSIQGWYKYPAVTEVTCPVEVSVPAMCSLPSVRVRRCPFPSKRCVPAEEACPRGVLNSCLGVTQFSRCPRCHFAMLVAIPPRPDGGALRWPHLTGCPDRSQGPASGRRRPGSIVENGGCGCRPGGGPTQRDVPTGLRARWAAIEGLGRLLRNGG